MKPNRASSIGRNATIPPDLSPDAARFWANIVQEYDLADAAGLLLLERACRALMRARELDAVLAKDGLLVPDRAGRARAHPASALLVEAERSLRGALRELHLDLEPLRHGPGRPPGK